jgi:hypothetical protein
MKKMKREKRNKNRVIKGNDKEKKTKKSDIMMAERKG